MDEQAMKDHIQNVYDTSMVENGQTVTLLAYHLNELRCVISDLRAIGAPDELINRTSRMMGRCMSHFGEFAKIDSIAVVQLADKITAQLDGTSTPAPPVLTIVPVAPTDTLQ